MAGRSAIAACCRGPEHSYLESVPGKKSETVNQFQLRARLPKIFGLAAAAVLVVTVGLIAYSIFFRVPDPAFRMSNFPANLSQDVVATVNGYERREMDGQRTLYFIRADKATSFSDNHQELENVFLEVFGEDGASSDKISALKAVYVPADDKNFTAYFAGSVNIDTRDHLKVKTEQVTYTKENETAAAEEAVEFERANVRGSSFGAIVRVGEKQVELLRDVKVHADSETTSERSTLTAGHAVYDQGNERIDLSNGMTAEFASASEAEKPARISTLKAGRSTAFLGIGIEEKRSIDKIELFENVHIESREGDGPLTRIDSQYAHYQKPIDRFDLRGGVHILTEGGSGPTEVRAENAVYDQDDGQIDLTGNASVAQGSNLVEGGVIHAELNAAKKVRLAEVSENASVKQTAPERSTEVSGPRIKAAFSDDQALTSANVIGQGLAVLVPTDPGDYTKLTMSAAQAIDVTFKGEGMLDKMITKGRTNIKMDVPNRSPDAANKSVAADNVTTEFAANGKDMSRAVAVGNAELILSPLAFSENNYQTTVNAPRFDCEFFPAGSDPKTCVALDAVKTVRVPTRPAADRGTQTLTSDKLTANFDAGSRELASLEALGSAKFNERDRNGTSEKIIYTTADQTVRLRGGSPNVWDGKARAKAPEIDWNTRDEVSELRGGASTTYYSVSNTGGAAPFAKSEKPVYVTADNARFDHRGEVAVFTGNARGWQDKNYVRGHRLTMSQKDGRFVAEENVQSLLYDAKRRENGAETNQPVFVAAQKLVYTRDDRHIRYENNVDIRQGKDRITGGTADIFLNENDEPSKTEIRQNVVMTQPDRRATGDYVRYDSEGEIAFLEGSPATVEDTAQGRTQASQITMNLKENRFAGEGPSRQNPAGRMRSVYKPQNQ